MFGWFGKTLRVDLTNEMVTTEEIDPQVAEDFIGCRGLGIKYLCDEVDPTIDPLMPENKLIFSTGPLTGTPVPTGNRYAVMTKSPLTGTLSRSNSGGDFPNEMKRTGFDQFVFEGRASQPVYLWVHDDEIEIRSAEHLWGKTVPETEDILLQETSPKAKVACIGPAGERLVKVAAIMNDKHRAAARSGVGAVMGSKNLKAVVVHGTRKVPMADPTALQDLNHLVRSEVGGDVKKGSALREYGTAYIPLVTDEIGILPTRNFQTGVFEGVENISGHVLKDKYLVRAKPCFGCPIACGRETRVEDAKYGSEGEGPEYETIVTLGSACGVDNLAAITKANYLCNELGLDTISAGMTIACAMEMYEKGVLPEGDVGRPLHFADADAVIALVQQMAYRQGFGDALAEGSYRLASKYGRREFSITTKKLELPGYDPRGAKGMGLLYATSNIGASHMVGHVGYTEIFGFPTKTDPLTTKDKPRLVKLFEDVFAVIDAAGLCVFLAVRYLFDRNPMLWPTRLVNLMNQVTGTGYTEESLLQAGERIYNLERLFVLKAGLTRADDTLPQRMLQEPLPDGPGTGHVVELDQMLNEFYRLRGWDENGIPTTERLQSLGLPSLRL